MSNIIKIPLRNVNAYMFQDLQEKYPDAELNIEIGQHQPDGLLTEQQFWELIDLLDWNKEDDDDAVTASLVSALALLPVRQIYDFADILSQKLYFLDGVEFARHIGERSWQPDAYFSVDGFLYVRCCAVANGKKAFEQILKNPKLMPKDMDFEPLLYVASDAFEQKTGMAWDYIPAFNMETYSNKAGWENQTEQPQASAA